MKYSIANQAPKNSSIMQAEFILSTGLLGAPTLSLHLNIDTTSSSFTGSARLSQATTPLPTFSSAVKGQYIPIITQGQLTPVYCGNGFQLTTPIFDNLDFSFDLTESKAARFKYKACDTDDWIIIEDAHVEEIR